MATVEQRVPPLSPGDNLSREEFLRCWELNPEIKKAELIGGIVYMPSPVSVEHGDTEGDVGLWLVSYRVATPGCAGGHNTTTFLLEDVAQPDLNLRILPEFGGSSWVEGKYLQGASELFAEVCRSSSAYDLHQKLELYREAGVKEYIAFLLFEREIRWHVLDDGSYRLLLPDAAGILHSRVFPGLWLDGQAFWNGDMHKVLATLQEGLSSAEHQAFVALLAQRKR